MRTAQGKQVTWYVAERYAYKCDVLVSHCNVPSLPQGTPALLGDTIIWAKEKIGHEAMTRIVVVAAVATEV